MTTHHHYHACNSEKQQLFYEKKALLDLELPPRRQKNHLSIDLPVHQQTISLQELMSSLSLKSEGEEGMKGSVDEEIDLYSSDEFRMYDFKVRRCMRGRSHDWTDCPFSHPGEKARRRDPRKHHYSGSVCPDFRRVGSCPRGDACEHAHGVFECWLHPARYRTMPCKDGRRCRRKVCFFAHSPTQLRVLPDWHCAILASPSTALSPTTPFTNFSPPVSPPISPCIAERRLSCLGNAKGSASKFLCHDALFEELMKSLDAMERSALSPVAVLNANASSSVASPNVVARSDRMRGIGNATGDGVGPNFEWVDDLLM